MERLLRSYGYLNFCFLLLWVFTLGLVVLERKQGDLSPLTILFFTTYSLFVVLGFAGVYAWSRKFEWYRNFDNGFVRWFGADRIRKYLGEDYFRNG